MRPLINATITVAALLVGSGAGHATLWFPPLDVRPQTYGNDQFPKLALPPGQAPHVIWLGADSLEGDAEIFAARWNGVAWGTAVTINPPNRLSELSPRVSVAGDGSVWVVWKAPDPVSRSYVGLVARSTGGGAWSGPDTVWSGGGRYDVPAVAALSEDEAWIIRDGYPAGRFDSDIFAYHLVGHEVESVHQFTQLGTDEIVPSITVDGQGEPWAVWYRLNWSVSNQDRMWYARRLNGAWAAPDSILEPRGMIAPKMVSDQDGHVWIVTQATDPLDPYVPRNSETVWALRWEGSVWGSPIRLHDPLGSFDSIQLHLSVTRMPGANPRAIWVKGNMFSLSRRDLITSAWDGTAWTPPERIGDVADSGRTEWPDVADDGITIWAAYGRQLKQAPFNFNVFTYRSVPGPTTGVQATFDATPLPAGVLLQWSVHPPPEPLALRIYRHAAGPASGGTIPPADAITVTELGEARASAGSFLDRSLTGTGDFDYWLEIRYSAAPPAFLGPHRVRFEARRPKNPALLYATPNPSSGPVMIHGQAETGAASRVEIFDIHGRRVRTLLVRQPAPGPFELSWDGRDDRGGPSGSGVYFARLRGATSPGRGHTIRILLLE